MTTFDGSTEPDRRAAREVEAVLCSKLSEAEFFYLLAQGHLDDVTLTGRAGAEEAAAVLRERRLRKNERNTASVAKQDRAASLQRFERAVSAAVTIWGTVRFRSKRLRPGGRPTRVQRTRRTVLQLTWRISTSGNRATESHSSLRTRFQWSTSSRSTLTT